MPRPSTQASSSTPDSRLQKIQLFLASFLLVLAATGASAGDSHDNQGDGDDATHAVQLRWVDVPAADSLHLSSTPSLELEASNLVDEALAVNLRIEADRGHEKRFRLRVPGRIVRPGEAQRWTVDLEAAGFDLGDMRFSGQLSVNATATSLKNPGPIPRELHFFAPDIFFHAEPTEGFYFYGEEALQTRFGSGDLEGTLPTFDFGAVQRVSGGGSSTRPTGPGDLTSNDRRICVEWQIGITDASRKVITAGGDLISEDYWVKTPSLGDLVPADYDPTKFVVPARGVRVTLVDTANDWSDTYTANPANGCFTFNQPVSDQILLIAWAHSTDADGNRVIAGLPVANDQLWPFLFVEEIEPPPPAKSITVRVGNYSARATMAAIGGFASFREHFGLENQEIRMREDATCGSSGGANSSAHFDASTFSQGIANIRIHNGQGMASDGSGACSGSDMRRWKFLIGHEMGHAWLLLATGKNSFEPWVDANLCDSTETVCNSTGSGYSIGSLEWSSVAIREGIAHFYATAVWNRTSQSDGVFTWFLGPWDVELDDDAEPGGRLFNECDTDLGKCGRGTIVDWMRFFWDWHTPFSAQKPSTEQMRDIYVRAALGHFDGDLDISKDTNYYRLRQAMLAETPSQTQRDSWDSFASLNGTASNNTSNRCEVNDYPDCECWVDRCAPMPEICRGELGCPCSDVDLTGFTVFDLDQDGYYPDGEASYAIHGSDGPGQYCSDALVESVCGYNEVVIDEIPEDVATCRECGVDTHFGCACESDADCQGLDGVTLSCWGATENGWAGSGSGTCLPDAGTPAGREHLTELPWICLDNCASKGSSHRCAFDQLLSIPPGIELQQAQCVDILCGPPPVGSCESQGQFCQANNGGDFCVAECTESADCPLLGFPDHYGCASGHCVPSECLNPAPALQAYCQLFE